MGSIIFTFLKFTVEAMAEGGRVGIGIFLPFGTNSLADALSLGEG